MPLTPEEAARRRSLNKKILTFGCLPITALLVIVIAIAATSDSDTGSTEPSEQMAAVMCEGFVKKRLKSPGSAEFSGVTDTDITTVSDKKPWQYKVTAYVDSQNSFGAKIRNNYVCTISTKDNHNWTLDDLDMTAN